MDQLYRQNAEAKRHVFALLACCHLLYVPRGELLCSAHEADTSRLNLLARLCIFPL